MIEIVCGAAPAVIAEAISAWLDDQPDMVVVGASGVVSELVELALRNRGAIAVLDSSLPEAGSIEACAGLKANEDSPRVLVVGQSGDTGWLVASVEAGADGYLDPDEGIESLADAVRRVARGEAHVPPALLGALLQSLIRRRRDEDGVVSRFLSLSRRERRVVQLLVTGADHRRIASEMIISPHTARSHIQNILTKLGTHSTAEVVKLAEQYGLLARFVDDEAD